LYKVA